MEFYDEKIKALAIEIYELDAEVYKKLGSSLGRVFGGEKDICIRNIMAEQLKNPKRACPDKQHGKNNT